MVIHILTPQGEQTVVQVVDGKVVVPQATPADQTPEATRQAG